MLWRQSTLTFVHLRLVGPRDDAETLLHWCLETPEPRSTAELRTRMKQVRRADREEQLADGYRHAGATEPW